MSLQWADSKRPIYGRVAQLVRAGQQSQGFPQDRGSNPRPSTIAIRRDKKYKMKVKLENEVISIQHESVGSIKHFVSIKSGRCTFYTNEYMRETCRPSVNVAATLEEIEHVRDAFNTIITLMKKGMPDQPKTIKEKHPSGKRGFLITLPDGKSISVLDFSDVMKTAPKQVKDCVYMGWEAWDGEETFRAKTAEEVEKLLSKKYTLNY